MRVPSALVVLVLSVPVQASAASLDPGQLAGKASRDCPRTASYLAEQGSIYRGAPLAPKKLTQLPPGTTFMAVYRRIDGCDAPLTMVEYRNSHRR